MTNHLDTAGANIGTDDLAEAGCASFEATLDLLDGALSGAALAKARAHADGCALCGPMVSGWAPAAAALKATFDDAAERAKPDLAKVADAVLARVAKPRPVVAATPATFGERFLSFLRTLQAPVVLGAAAFALVLVLGPIAKDATDEGLTAAPNAPALAIDDVDADDADVMVLEAPDDDSAPVIWITEHEGV
jgi:hypothetical protein